LDFCVGGELDNSGRRSGCVSRLETNVKEQPSGPIRKEPVTDVVRGSARRTGAALNVNNDEVLGVTRSRSRKG
jgi:hypothetical protein